MPEDTRVLLTRWFDEVWNQNREETMDELMASDAISHGFPSQGSSSTAKEFKEAVQQFQRTFSNIHVAIEDMLVDGEKAAVRWKASLTHTGDGLGFAPTGDSIQVAGISIVHLEHGKIIEGWDALDLTTPIDGLRQTAIARLNSTGAIAS